MNQEKQIRHLPYKWCQIKGVKILDPIGWRMDKKNWNAPITEAEFITRADRSTTSLKKYSFNPGIDKELENAAKDTNRYIDKDPFVLHETAKMNKILENQALIMRALIGVRR